MSLKSSDGPRLGVSAASGTADSEPHSALLAGALVPARLRRDTARRATRCWCAVRWCTGVAGGNTLWDSASAKGKFGKFNRVPLLVVTV